MSFRSLWLVCAVAALPVLADTRMQVVTPSTSVYGRPEANAQTVGQISVGAILFVTRTEGDWAAISPPDHLGVWLNKDFVESNRVIAKSIQIRTGPGIQYDIVGTLERGAPVMPIAEEGEWCKIAPPSSATMWVKKSNLSEVAARTTPIREVTPASTPPHRPEPAPASVQTAQTEPPSPPPAVPKSEPVRTTPPPAQPRPIAAVSTPGPASTQPTASPERRNPQPLRPATAVPRPAQPAPAVATADQPHLNPLAASRRPISGGSTSPGLQRSPIRQPVAATGRSSAQQVPAPAVGPAAQKPQDLEVYVDPAFVEDLDLIDHPGQGKSIQVEGQLRQTPFSTAASPSRYRLLAREDGNLVMICYVHGDSAALRPYVGKEVAIRGRQYWVKKDSSLPVVVAGQLVSLTPEEEAIRF
ncbi:MAG: SH3 domain-containing protein [Verrucomicrobiota bacterium]|jgi:hypothetical protein|nr:SH3 domain-containing protein [Verrucomicrobiota bacterium]